MQLSLIRNIGICFPPLFDLFWFGKKREKDTLSKLCHEPIKVRTQQKVQNKWQQEWLHHPNLTYFQINGGCQLQTFVFFSAPGHGWGSNNLLSCWGYLKFKESKDCWHFSERCDQTHLPIYLDLSCSVFISFKYCILAVFWGSACMLEPQLHVQIYLIFFIQPALRWREVKHPEKFSIARPRGPSDWGPPPDARSFFSNSVRTHAGHARGKNVLFAYHFDGLLGPIAITKTPRPITAVPETLVFTNFFFCVTLTGASDRGTSKL